MKKDFRCFSCDKLIAKAKKDAMEIKCSRCGTLNAMFSKMPEQVIVTGPAGLILFVNEAVEKKSGYSLEEIVGSRPSLLWGKGMPDEFYREAWEKMKREKKVIHLVLDNVTKSGEKYRVNLAVNPVFDTEGQIIFYVGVESDHRDDL